MECPNCSVYTFTYFGGTQWILYHLIIYYAIRFLFFLNSRINISKYLTFIIIIKEKLDFERL